MTDMRRLPRVFGLRALVVLVAALLTIALTARLGVWQLSRADEKEARQALLDARGQLPAVGAAHLARDAAAAAEQFYRPVVLRGTWLDAHTVFLDNRQMNARPGFFVVTPLRLSGSGESVLVQRGWLPRHSTDRTRIAPFDTTAGEVEVRGRIAPPPARLYEFDAAASGAIRQNLDLAAYAGETGLRLLPLSVMQERAPQDADDGLLREWPRPTLDVHKHYGYAFQWFALCALTAGLYVWFQLIRPWRQRRRHA